MCLAARRYLLSAHRAGVCPPAPSGRVVDRPFDEVEVEGPHHHEMVGRVDPSRYNRVMAPLLSTERVVLVTMRCFQPVATSAAKRNESMPGWCSSRSRQNSRPKV